MGKVRVGIIGCGSFSQAQHLPNCQKNEKIELTWCCDLNKDTLKQVEKEFSPPKLTTRAEELLQAKDVDMVIISLPHTLHAEMIISAASYGKHILCEKPMVMNMEEAYRVIKAVHKAGVKLCVDFNRRFSPSLVELKRVYVKHRKNPQPTPWKPVFYPERPPLPEEETTMVMIHINDESSTYNPIHIDPKMGGGEILGEGCHWLDWICWFLEEEPVRIFATGSLRMNYIVTLDFPSGSRASIFFSANGTFDYPKELYMITDHGALFINHCFVENQWYGIGEPVKKTYPLQYDECPEVKGEGLEGYLGKIRRRREVYLSSGKRKWLKIFPDKGHYQLLDAFIESILKDTPSLVDEWAGTRATYLSLKAMESIRCGHLLPIIREDYQFSYSD